MHAAICLLHNLGEYNQKPKPFIFITQLSDRSTSLFKLSQVANGMIPLLLTLMQHLHMTHVISCMVSYTKV